VLYTASFYDPQDWKGRSYRISRAHPRGLRTQWDTAPFLYPVRELLRAYREGAVDFATLSREYRQALDAAYDQLGQFQEWALGLPSLGDFTLLCFEREGKPCHRRLAAGWLLERVPGLICGELR
jgi:uncharacterized protein YeaO (DUF488 family)